jgi:hypothetical protein
MLMHNKIFKFVICIQLLAISISAYDDSNVGSASSFEVPSLITAGTSLGDVTKVEATKTVLPTDNINSIDINLSLTMPPTPAKLDIVLAMDTSGSMAQNYMDDNSGETQIQWASRTIGSMIEQYQEARLSIVSWDDEDEQGDIATKFFNLSNQPERAEVEKILRDLPQSECKETDHTIYSIGIKRAVEVMDRYPPTDPHNTARIIIFVTGLSEFRAEPKNASNEITLDYQLQNAKRNRYWNGTLFNGYQIFPVQIGIDPMRFPWEYDNLSNVMNATKINGEPARNGPYSQHEINNLSEEIDKILIGLRSRPLAQDIEVIDTLYPYLQYLGSNNSRNIPVNGDNEPIRSADGSTTLRWNIGKMNSNDTWWALIHTRLNLSLPIEVSDNKTDPSYRIDNTTPVSEVRYTWFTGFNGILPFPEGEIKLGAI